jgi:putative hemolysin
VITELAIIFGLTCANGLLAGAEIAVVAVRGSRVRELLDGGVRSARALAQLRQNSERFLATVQIGITLVSATAAAFGGAAFSADLVPWLSAVPGLAPYAEEVALAAVIVLISYLSVVVGELVPKSLALRVSERYALLAARPLLGLSRLAAPAVWFLTRSSNLLLRPFHDQTNFTEARISLEEVRTMVGEASRAGSLDRAAGEIASRALDFADLTAAEVMVHRRFVVALTRDASAEDLRRALLVDGHRRIPVYEGTIDQVVGYVSWRDVIEQVWAGREPQIAALLRPVHFVPETRPAADLLREMRERRIHLAVALDEHGGMAGIVTLEDLLEEIVGEIQSEHDQPAADPGGEVGGARLFPGTTPVRDLERALGVDFRQVPEDYDTLGGWCLALAGNRLPKVGERFEVEGFEFVVAEASARRVRSVAVRRLLPPDGASAPQR